MPGTLIENVPPLPGKPIEETDPQDLDLTDGSVTENTRFAYPLSANPNVAEGASGPHPRTIVLLTADAFGVLPPVSILDRGRGHVPLRHRVHVEARRHRGRRHRAAGHVQRLLRRSVHVAQALGLRRAAAASRWSGTRPGASCSTPAGAAAPTGRASGSRSVTPACCSTLRCTASSTTRRREIHPIFNLRMPKHCPGVPTEILNPRNTWDDPEAYDAAALEAARHVPRELRGQGIRRTGHQSGDVTPSIAPSGSLSWVLSTLVLV